MTKSFHQFLLIIIKYQRFNEYTKSDFYLHNSSFHNSSQIITMHNFNYHSGAPSARNQSIAPLANSAPAMSLCPLVSLSLCLSLCLSLSPCVLSFSLKTFSPYSQTENWCTNQNTFTLSILNLYLLIIVISSAVLCVGMRVTITIIDSTV